MPQMTLPQKQLRARTLTLLTTTQAAAAASLEGAAAAETHAAAKAGLESKHPEFAEAELRDHVRFVVVLVALAAAIALDLVLVAPVGEFIAMTYLGLGGAVAETVGYAFPFFLLVTELGVGQLRISPLLSPAGRAVFTAMALGLLITVPALAAITARTSMALGGDLSELLVPAMALLSGAVHGFVLFGGEAQAEAFAWALWSSRVQKYRTQAEQAKLKAGRMADEACEAFTAWAESRDHYLAEHATSNRLPQPYFSPEAAELINRRFGYEVIARPTGGGNPTPGGGDARTRRAREAETEVVDD